VCQEFPPEDVEDVDRISDRDDQSEEDGQRHERGDHLDPEVAGESEYENQRHDHRDQWDHDTAQRTKKQGEDDHGHRHRDHDQDDHARRFDTESLVFRPGQNFQHLLSRRLARRSFVPALPFVRKRQELHDYPCLPSVGREEEVHQIRFRVRNPANIRDSICIIGYVLRNQIAVHYLTVVVDQGDFDVCQGLHRLCELNLGEQVVAQPAHHGQHFRRKDVVCLDEHRSVLTAAEHLVKPILCSLQLFSFLEPVVDRLESRAHVNPSLLRPGDLPPGVLIG
jgi:hypothetical protein